MNGLQLATLFWFLTLGAAFVPEGWRLPGQTTRMPTTTTCLVALSAASSSSASASSQQETEAERLLRKARELRAAAEQAEQQVHGDLHRKKIQQDAQTDAWISQVLEADDSVAATADRLRARRFSMATLERILLRLEERQVRAQGWEHVQGTVRTDTGHTEFQRVAAQPPDPIEMQRWNDKVEQFIAAVTVLDDEFVAKKQAAGQKYVAATQVEHWGGGKAAAALQARMQEIRRERSEHFQARQKELQDAQRRNKDHQFEGYTDLGSLN